MAKCCILNHLAKTVVGKCWPLTGLFYLPDGFCDNAGNCRLAFPASILLGIHLQKLEFVAE
jgi:hypothetical protein